MVTTHEMDYQEALVNEGVVVIPSPLSRSATARADSRRAFDACLRSSPEFQDARPQDDAWFPVLGGFAALGNPSSFHAEFPRQMREMTLALLLDEDALPARGRLVEVAFDRMLMRKKGVAM